MAMLETPRTQTVEQEIGISKDVRNHELASGWYVVPNQQQQDRKLAESAERILASDARREANIGEIGYCDVCGSAGFADTNLCSAHRAEHAREANVPATPIFRTLVRSWMGEGTADLIGFGEFAD